MTKQITSWPLKVGLLIVALSYFLFTVHAMFTLQWIGEWEYLTGTFNMVILVEDISATIGLVFRLLASIIALLAVIFYISKREIPKPRLYNMLKLIFVFEGIYWLGLAATGVFNVYSFARFILNGFSASFILNSLMLGVIPSLVESIVLPVALFILAFKLNPNKPLKPAIKWAGITGLIYVVVFWLINSSIWIGTIQNPELGTEYLTSYPQNLLSFVLTLISLPLLAIFTAYFAKKSSRAETFQELKIRTIGAIVLGLGMYFLWNYASWVFFGDGIWSNWYRWFLGHNMDLWMLSLPLVALPLLFYNKPHEGVSNSQ